MPPIYYTYNDHLPLVTQAIATTLDVTKTQKNSGRIHMPIATQARLTDFLDYTSTHHNDLEKFPTFMTKNG